MVPGTQQSIEQGELVTVPGLTALLMGVCNLPEVLSTLGCEAARELMRTWHTQCNAISHSAPVTVIGGSSPQVRSPPRSRAAAGGRAAERYLEVSNISTDTGQLLGESPWRPYDVPICHTQIDARCTCSI